MRTLTDNAFPEPRKDGDICLVTAITDILRAEGHADPMAWQADPSIQEALRVAPKLQQFLINRYWRQRLGLCSFNTSAPRFCLFDDGTVEEYLKVFKDAVAPIIAKNQVL